VLTPAAGAWLLQAAASLPDTIITKQVAQPRDWFNTVSGIASILISLALLALCVGLIPAAWNFRKSYAKVNDLLEKVYGDINPLMRHASTIADNVNYISTSIRVDVQQVNQTIATANERLQEAVRLTERRVAEFNALLHVVQQEAEGAFVATAATLRGVREGAATFRDDAMTSAALRRTMLEARLGERLDERLEESLAARGGDEYDYLDADELDDLDHLDADLADEMEDVAHAEAEALDADEGAGTADTLESGELIDGDSRGVPPLGGRERPRIRSRSRPDAGRRDA
jgi:uncharacterized protein YoxC